MTYAAQTAVEVFNPIGIPGQETIDFPGDVIKVVATAQATLKSGQGVKINVAGDGTLEAALVADAKEVNGIVVFDPSKVSDGDAFDRNTFLSGETVTIMKQGSVILLAKAATTIPNQGSVAIDFGGVIDVWTNYVTASPPLDGRVAFVQARSQVDSGKSRLFIGRINYQVVERLA